MLKWGLVNVIWILGIPYLKADGFFLPLTKREAQILHRKTSVINEDIGEDAFLKNILRITEEAIDASNDLIK